MNDANKTKGQDIFLKALGIDDKKQQAFVQQQCQGNAELEDYVHSLISASQSSDDFFDDLENSISDSQLNEIEDYQFRNNDFGNYRIIKALKQGGMGTIFLAQRADGEFERQVVIKMIPIDLDFSQSQSQFAHEKEILASLVHPNIVQLYDSGVTKNGQSYFVMELVKGKTLINYCNDKQLTIKQRLALFHEVLAAVGFAHQHLVIHGDIKPSNIMVNEDKQIKLLDFGIAKLVDNNDTTLNGYSLNYLTPEHKDKKPIITTTDIHQLGQLLLELLINLPPKELRQANFEFKPLQKIYDDLSSLQLKELTHNTKTPAARLKKIAHSDLSAIISKALACNPKNRYNAIQAFDDDLSRYEKGYCISAKNHSLYYRLNRYINRNKILTASMVLLLLVSSIFTLITIHNNKKLALERDKALTVKNLITEVFTTANPSFSPGKELTATEVLDNGLKKIREKFTSHTDIEAELLTEIAKTYQNLGEYQKAQNILTEVYQINKQLHSGNDLIHAQSMLLLGENSRLMSKMKLAKEWLDKSLAILIKDPASNKKLIASAKSKLGRVMVLLGEFSQAEKLLNESTTLSKQIYGTTSLEYAQALNDLNSVYFRLGKYQKVQQLLLKSKHIREQLLPKANGYILNTDYATNINNLGLAFYLHGNLTEAESYFHQAIELRNKIFTKPHPEQAQSLTNLGLLLNDMGKPQQALPYLQKALEVREATLNPDHMRIIDAKNNLAMAYHESSKFDQAEEIYQSILPKVIKIQGKNHLQTLSIMTNRANTLLALGNYQQAYELFSTTLNLRKKSLPKDHLYLSYSYLGLGKADLALNYLEAAEKNIDEAIAIRQAKLPADNWLIGEALLAKTELLIRQNKADNELTKKACDILSKSKGKNNYLTIKCTTLLNANTQAPN